MSAVRCRPGRRCRLRTGWRGRRRRRAGAGPFRGPGGSEPGRVGRAPRATKAVARSGLCSTTITVASHADASRSMMACGPPEGRVCRRTARARARAAAGRRCRRRCCRHRASPRAARPCSTRLTVLRLAPTSAASSRTPHGSASVRLTSASRTSRARSLPATTSCRSARLVHGHRSTPRSLSGCCPVRLMSPRATAGSVDS